MRKRTRNKNMKKVIALILIVVMAISTLPSTNTYAITQSTVEAKLSSLMKQYVNTTWNGYYYGSQCKGFANLIFQNIFGVYIGPYPSNANYMISNPNANTIGILAPGRMTQSAATELLKKSAPGDYLQVRRKSGGQHSMIIVNHNDSGITVFDCNSDGKNGVKSYFISWSTFCSKNVAMSLYRDKNYNPVTVNNPQGVINNIKGGTGYIDVSGYAFDKDDISKSIMIHVYIGGPAGVGEGHIITANGYRSDVGSAYGVGNYHGFSGWIRTNKRGNQSVYVYAINIGSGENVLLGSKTINIANGNVPDGIVEKATGGTGCFSVTGWAYDADNISKALQIHVYVGNPSMAGSEGHVIVANKERKDVGTAKKVGNYHGFSDTITTNKTGKQTLYLYAINVGAGDGNKFIGTKEVTITAKPKTYKVTGVSITNSSGRKCTSASVDMNKSLALKASISPGNATNKNVTWSSENTAIATVNSNGVVTGKKCGTTNIKVVTKDGNYSAKCSVSVRDTQKPVISNVKVTGLSASGFTVTCTVSDNVAISKVMMPTWTAKSGQDDLIWHQATVKGKQATFTVKANAHKNESGKYITDIYAYDKQGNEASYRLNVNVPVDTVKPKISNVKVTGVTKSGYTITCTVSDNVAVSKVMMPTWTSKNGQDDLVWHQATVKGNQAKFTVKTNSHKKESGKYITDIYVYDKKGNEICYRVNVTVP